MERKERQRLVDQEVSNAQMIQFIADRQAEIASQVDRLQKEQPQLAEIASDVAAVEREHRRTLMEIAREDKRLATEIQLETMAPEALAALTREHRKDLLEIARQEGRLAEVLKGLNSDDPAVEDTLAVLAEQADRDRQLLRQAAHREAGTDQAMRADEPAPK